MPTYQRFSPLDTVARLFADLAAWFNSGPGPEFDDLTDDSTFTDFAAWLGYTLYEGGQTLPR